MGFYIRAQSQLRKNFVAESNLWTFVLKAETLPLSKVGQPTLANIILDWKLKLQKTSRNKMFRWEIWGFWLRGSVLLLSLLDQRCYLVLTNHRVVTVRRAGLLTGQAVLLIYARLVETRVSQDADRGRKIGQSSLIWTVFANWARSPPGLLSDQLLFAVLARWRTPSREFYVACRLYKTGQWLMNSLPKQVFSEHV